MTFPIIRYDVLTIMKALIGVWYEIPKLILPLIPDRAALCFNTGQFFWISYHSGFDIRDFVRIPPDRPEQPTLEADCIFNVFSI